MTTTSKQIARPYNALMTLSIYANEIQLVNDLMSAIEKFHIVAEEKYDDNNYYTEYKAESFEFKKPVRESYATLVEKGIVTKLSDDDAADHDDDSLSDYLHEQVSDYANDEIGISSELHSVFVNLSGTTNAPVNADSVNRLNERIKTAQEEIVEYAEKLKASWATAA